MTKYSTSFFTFFIILFSSSAFAQLCINGFAGDYPCDKIDQTAMMPLAMFEAANANDVWGWTNPETGREFVALGLDNKTAFIDITSPQYPIYIGYLPTQTIASLWRDIKVLNGYAVVVAEAPLHGMQIFDMRRLESVSFEDTPVVFDTDAYYNGFGNAHNIVIDVASKFAYAVGSNTFGGRLHIVNLLNPLNPFYAGSADQDQYTHDAQVVVYNGPDVQYQGRQICVASNQENIAIFDVTSKTNVILISTQTYENVGYTHQAWLTEDHRYLLVNDETDELATNSLGEIPNTRTIIFDVQNLNNPMVIGEYFHGNTAIDHNLYIRDNLVYFSNYTSGLRMADVNDVAQGQLNYFGFFDVVPANDNTGFTGTWSNYPYFESGVVPTTSMYAGLHFLRPRLYNLPQTVIKVCEGNEISAQIEINRPIVGNVNYAIEMASVPGLSASLQETQSDGAPAQNSIQFSGLNSVPPGYYPGHVIVTFNGEEIRLPFVLILDGDSPQAPELVAPVDDVTLPIQQVDFTFSDAEAGYVILEVSTDADFDNIVYQEMHYSTATTISVTVPFDLSNYFWRLRKPTACGGDVVSETGTFNIGAVSLVNQRDNVDLFSLYPNPATDMVFINLNVQGVDVLRVYDLSGRMVDTWNVQQGTSFSVGQLAPGIYVVRAPQGGKGQKLVVN